MEKNLEALKNSVTTDLFKMDQRLSAKSTSSYITTVVRTVVKVIDLTVATELKLGGTTSHTDVVKWFEKNFTESMTNVLVTAGFIVRDRAIHPCDFDTLIDLAAVKYWSLELDHLDQLFPGRESTRECWKVWAKVAERVTNEAEENLRWAA